MKIQEIAIVDITVSQNRRKLSKAAVGSLMSSILDVGLLNPIGVTADMKLIHGRHRLEAYRELGRKTIMATIHEVDDLHAELAEIDENLHRKQLSSVEECAALARRKQLWEEIHPNTKHGGDRKSGQKSSGQNGHLIEKSFADDTSMKTGRSSRSVRRDVEIGEAIPDDVVKKIAGTAIADNKSELKKLAKLDCDEQRVVADLLAEGQVATVTEAITPKDEPASAPAAPKERRKTTAAKKPVKVQAVDRREIAVITRMLTDAIDELDDAAANVVDTSRSATEEDLLEWQQLLALGMGHIQSAWESIKDARSASSGGADDTDAIRSRFSAIKLDGVWIPAIDGAIFMGVDNAYSTKGAATKSVEYWREKCANDSQEFERISENAKRYREAASGAYPVIEGEEDEWYVILPDMTDHGPYRKKHDAESRAQSLRNQFAGGADE